MKRYIKLQCTACKRERDELIRVSQYTPDKCTITLGCEGRLSPVGFTNNGANTVGVPPAGLVNWYPRGQTLNANVELIPESLYSTSTGSNQQIILAVRTKEVISDDAYVSLKLEAEQQSSKDYRQYTYRRAGGIQLINGVEDNQAKKVLRYSSTNGDLVQVYVNGIKLNEGLNPEDYQLYGDQSPTPANSIYFNSPLTGGFSQIDVIVTKKSTISEIELKFIRMTDDESRLGLGAWEGIESVKLLNETWKLFYCDISKLVSPPELDIKLRLSDNPTLLIDGAAQIVLSNQPNTRAQNSDTAAILLSRENLFTHIDRQRSNWVPITNLKNNTNFLITKLVNNTRTVFVSETSISPLFPALIPKSYSEVKILKTRLNGNVDAAELDNNLVVGPDQ